MRRVIGQLMLAILAFLFAIAADAPQRAHGADGADGGGVATKEIGKKGKRISGRLPPHFAKVVSEQQREKIYQIQEQYNPKITAARAAWEALRKQRDDEISAVLTPEQRKQVEQAATNSKKRKQTAAETRNVAGDSPAPPADTGTSTP